MSPKRQSPVWIRAQAIMSRKVSIYVDLEILITFANEIKNSCSIFLLIRIFTQQEIIGCSFGACPVKWHIDCDFIYKLALLFNLDCETAEIGRLFALFKFLLDCNCWMSKLLLVFRIWGTHCDVMNFDFIVSWVFFMQLIKMLWNLFLIFDSIVERLNDVWCIEKSLDCILVD